MTLALQNNDAVALDNKLMWAEKMSYATMLPANYRGNAGNLFFAVEYADALGISRIHALTSIHVIEGKPSASADLMAAMVRGAGHKLRVLGDDTYAEVSLVRRDDPDFEFKVRWTLERAQNAGLLMKGGKRGNWEKYPAAMLKARAISEVVRMGASDVMAGVIYTPEELGATVTEDGGLLEGVAAANAAHSAAQVESERVNEQPQQQSRPTSATSAGVAGLRDRLGGNTNAPAIDVDAFLDYVLKIETDDELRAVWERNKGKCGDRYDEALQVVTVRKLELENPDHAAPQADSAPQAEQAAQAEATPAPQQVAEGEQPVDAEVVPDPQAAAA